MRLENIVKKFDKIYEKVTTDAFLKMKALGGEVPFFISSYPIEQQNEVYSEIERLKHRLYEKSIEVVDGNLYDIVIEILQERNILERLLEKEKSLGPDKTKKTLLGVHPTCIHRCPAIRRRSHRQCSPLSTIHQDKPRRLFQSHLQRRSCLC